MASTFLLEIFWIVYGFSGDGMKRWFLTWVVLDVVSYNRAY
jgi:hypothetical protein